jgi:hypothetical protein
MPGDWRVTLASENALGADVPLPGGCRIISLPKIADDRGNLSFFESGQHISFGMARAYWIYDVPGGESRGQHAYREMDEFIVALSGSFEVLLDDGKNRVIVHMMRAYYGLYVPRMIWRKMQHFSTNAVALVVGSLPYSEGDYIRDYDEFQRLAGQE